MTENLSFLKKLSEQGSRSLGGDFIGAVLEHLEMLLNTRQGSVAHLPDYGLPDISTVFKSFPDSLEMLRRAIKNTITKYEPRLINVQVNLRESDTMVFRATFLVTGEIVEEDRTTRVGFQTTVSETGKTMVSP